MTSNTLTKFFAASFLAVTLAARASAHDDISPAIQKGQNTYSITVTASSAFMIDTDKLKDEANAAAIKYCSEHGKVLKVISLSSKSPHFSLGYCTGTIVFMALDAGDPSLLPPPPPAPAPEAYAPAAPRSLSTDELVAELTKLDDLRKKGILTDEEFQAEKKKVLSHSN